MPEDPIAPLIGSLDILGDATRLRLLRLLERHELGVAEMCAIVQLPQSTVSRHLKMLNDGGWVRRQKYGTNHRYRMVLDEVAPGIRQLWLLARKHSDGWSTFDQDELRLDGVLAERKGSAKSFFAGAAGQWDELRRQLYGRGFDRGMLLALLPADAVVADLGCGTGALACELAAHVKLVIGVDQSDAMLKAARERASDLTNVDLRSGDLDAIPIDDDVCDVAVLCLVLAYVADPERVIHETARIVCPGGRAVILDLLRHDQDAFRRGLGQQWPGFTMDELERWLREAGLESHVVQPQTPEPGAKGPALVVASGVKPLPN